LGTSFCGDLPEFSSRAFGSYSSASQGGAGEPVSMAIRTALGRLQLDAPPAQSAPSSTFFRCHNAKVAFMVPSSVEYIWTLHAEPFHAQWRMAGP
ncbi:hypothetical protein GOODEAATRI_030421, partial [Goodea atripinnis]